MTRRPRVTLRPQRADAPRAGPPSALAIVLAIVVIAASAVLGVLIAEFASQRSTEVSEPTPAPTVDLPLTDVVGEDLPGLGRYPGSVRAAYLHERQGSTQVTAIEYVTNAELDDVRAFYRRTFREHDWELIELDFSGGDWIFLVERGRRAALIEIEQRNPHVTIEIEVEQPVAAATPTPKPTPKPTPTPPPPPPPAPPPGDDDD